jgi:hypothetical protein
VAAADSDPEWRVPRFRPASDWYVVGERGPLVECVVWSTAERLLRVFLSLLEHLDAEVDVAIESVRDSQSWLGERRSLSDVRAALSPLQRPLVTHGGVEVSVYTPDEQLTITPALGLVIYARSDRWVYLLDAMGFAERTEAPPSDWNADGAPLADAPTLRAAVEQTVQLLALELRSSP